MEKVKEYSTAFENNWQEYLSGVLSAQIIHFLKLEFKARGIEKPTLMDLNAISWEDLENSWLSLQSCKNLLLFQQQINKNEKDA